MIVTNPTELIRNSKKIFDLIEKQETVIVHRQRGKDIVMISLDEWNKSNANKNNDYLHGYADETAYLLSNEANKKHILQGIKDIDQGRTTTIKTEDLWK